MATKKTKKPNKTSKAKEQATLAETEDVPVELSPEEEAKRNEKITFVANNILNNLSLNAAVSIIQQISLRDARTIVEGADEAKLKEIDDAMIAQAKANAEAAQQQTDQPTSPPETAQEQAEPALAGTE